MASCAQGCSRMGRRWQSTRSRSAMASASGSRPACPRTFAHPASWAGASISPSWSRSIGTWTHFIDERRILIDEVGPLELLRGEGWQGALRLVDDGSYDEAIVVVRPALIGVARQRWPWAQIVTVAEGGPAPP